MLAAACWLAVATGLQAQPPAISDANPAPAGAAEALLDKALAAGGGADRIGNLRNLRLKGLFSAGDKAALPVRLTCVGLEQMRLEMQLPVDAVMVLVRNGDKIWVRAGDLPSDEVAGEDLERLKDFFFALAVPDVLLQLKHKEYVLTPLPDAKVGGRDAAGVRVLHAHRHELRLYFDRQTGLPVKSCVLLPSPTGTDQTAECFFDGYKEFNGVKHFTHLRIRQGDADLFEIHIQELEFPERVKPTLFAKPF
jgi:hypothetical protein